MKVLPKSTHIIEKAVSAANNKLGGKLDIAMEALFKIADLYADKGISLTKPEQVIAWCQGIAQIAIQQIKEKDEK